MKKFCDACGSAVEPRSNYCTNCGKQISENDNCAQKKMQKSKLWIVAGVVALVCCLGLCVGLSYDGKKTDRTIENYEPINIDEFEKQLNKKLALIYNNNAIDLEIENVDEKDYDQTFSCTLHDLDENVVSVFINGRAKDGKVVDFEYQTLSTYETGEYYELFMEAMLPAVSVFNKDVLSIDDCAEFWMDMDSINDSPDGMVWHRIVKGTVEYANNSITSEKHLLNTINVRYLPAFESGYFEEKYG